MPIPSIGLGPFTEGVNLADPLTKLTSKELAQCLNLRMGVRGDFYKRPGYDYYGAPLAPTKFNGDNLVNLVVRYYKADSTKQLIVAAGGKLKLGNDATGGNSAINIDGSGANSCHISNLIDQVIYKNRIYLADGTKPIRYNGTDCPYAGHPLILGPSLVGGAGGALTPSSTYLYAITPVCTDMGEGYIASNTSILLTGIQNKVDLSGIPVPNARYECTTKKIYRTKANGSLFYFVAEIAAATTTYSDTMADSALGEENVPAHKPPNDARFVIIGHDDRAYWFGRTGLDASSVDVSEVGFPDRIKDTDFITVANNDGDIVTGGGLSPAGIVFFKRNTIWLSRAFGFGLINITPKEKRGVGLGTTSPFSIVATPAGLIFLSQRGEVYIFDGANVEEVGRKIRPQFEGMTQSAFDRVVSCYHDYRYQIAYDFRGTKGYNSKVLEYDIRTGKWEGPHENGDLLTPSYYSVWDSLLDKGELYWGEAKAANGSYVYGRNEFSKLDRGNKFISTVKTGLLAIAKLGEVISTKIFVYGRFSSDAKITATHIGEDGKRTPVQLNSPIGTGGTKWNDGHKLGPSGNTARFGAIVTQVSEGPLGASARARLPQYEITDGGTAVDMQMDLVEILANTLPLK